MNTPNLIHTLEFTNLGLEKTKGDRLKKGFEDNQIVEEYEGECEECEREVLTKACPVCKL